MAELPKTPLELPTQIPELPKLPKLPVDVQGLSDRLQPIMSSLIGEVLLGTVAFWLAVIGIVVLLLEVVVVTYRMWKGETFLSALLLWGSRRKKRTKPITEQKAVPVQEDMPVPAVQQEVEVSASVPVEEVQVLPIVEPPAPPPKPAEPVEPLATPPPPSEALALIAPAVSREPVAHSLAADPLPSGEDILSDMYAMKIGVLKVLRTHRALEDELGNVSGMQALDVLIASVETSDPQKIWEMGSRKIKNNTQ